MLRLARILSVLSAGVLLAGCGFHLAGLRPLPEPLRSVYIDSVTPYRVSEPPVETSLRALIRRRGGDVTGDARSARTVIRLSDLQERREVLSVGLDGKAIEYQLITRVRFEVHSAGRVLVPPDVLTASEDYSFQPQQVLAKEAEEARLRQFIQNELAELIMLRLDAQLSRPTLVPAVDMPAPSPEAAGPQTAVPEAVVPEAAAPEAAAPAADATQAVADPQAAPAATQEAGTVEPSGGTAPSTDAAPASEGGSAEAPATPAEGGQAAPANP